MRGRFLVALLLLAPATAAAQTTPIGTRPQGSPREDRRDQAERSRDERAMAEAEADIDLMDEPIEFTDVIDSFDDDDPFDLNFSIGYLRSQSFGNIQREYYSPASGAPRDLGSPQYATVGKSQQTTNGLIFGLDIGIFRDLAIYARLPLILSDERSIQSPGEAIPIDLVSRVPWDIPNPMMPDAQNPTPNFRSPTRSGIDYISAGLAWSLMNQHRSHDLPTWTLMIEGRFGVGTPLRACGTNPQGGAINCRGPSGMPGIGGEGAPNTTIQDPGISRGTNALRIETRASRRFRYIEPYAGLAFQVEWPGNSGRYFQSAGSLPGLMNVIPPLFGEITLGASVIPWEERGGARRFLIDLRLTGAYFSEGRDYSPLFDALGSNRMVDRDNLLGPVNENAMGGGKDVYFYGITDTASHGRIGGHLTLEIQAARYVRFLVGGSVWWDSPYMLTFSDACNPNFTATAGDPRIGNCTGNTILNPDYRPSIDLSGRRFRLDGETTFDFFARIVGQF